MASNSSTNSSDALREDLKTLREDVGHLAQSLKELTGEQSSNAYQSVREGAKAAGQKVRQTSEAASHVVEQRPLMSVFAAFGMGMLLGALFGRRSV